MDILQSPEDTSTMIISRLSRTCQIAQHLRAVTYRDTQFRFTPRWERYMHTAATKAHK